MLFPIKAIFPEGTVITIHLVFSLAVSTLEVIYIRLSLQGFKSWKV